MKHFFVTNVPTNLPPHIGREADPLIMSYTSPPSSLPNHSAEYFNAKFKLRGKVFFILEINLPQRNVYFLPTSTPRDPTADRGAGTSQNKEGFLSEKRCRRAVIIKLFKVWLMHLSNLTQRNVYYFRPTNASRESPPRIEDFTQ